MITKYYSKKQLAVTAGVSRTTFYRWMLIDQPVDLHKKKYTQVAHIQPLSDFVGIK